MHYKIAGLAKSSSKQSTQDLIRIAAAVEAKHPTPRAEDIVTSQPLMAFPLGRTLFSWMKITQGILR